MVIGNSIPDHPQNTCSIATMMYPPQLAWFPDDGECPYPRNQNRLHTIDWINDQINVINRRNGITEYLGAHTYGVRYAKKKWVDKFGQRRSCPVKVHRWNRWREQVKANQLHLSNEERFRLGHACNNYFIYNTL